MTATTFDPDVMIDIAADDGATPVLGRLHAMLRTLAPSISRVSEGVANLDRGGALSRFAGVASKVGIATAALGAKAARAAVPLAALSGTMVAAGLGKATADFANRAGELADASARLGVSVTDLQEFRYAGEQVGVGAEEMDKSLERLNKGIAEVADGGNQELGSLFKKLGINVRDSNGELRSAADIMPQLATAFEKNENAALRTRMAMTLFGKAGGALVPMLSQGADALAAARQEARDYGMVISEDGVKAGDELGDSWTKLTKSVTGLVNVIGEKLAPMVTDVVNKMADWIKNNKEWIGQGLEKIARGIGDAIAWIWEKTGDAIEAFKSLKTWSGEVVDAFKKNWEGIGDWFKKQFEGVQDLVEKLTNAIKSMGTESAALGRRLTAPLTANGRSGTNNLGGVMTDIGRGLGLVAPPTPVPVNPVMPPMSGGPPAPSPDPSAPGLFRRMNFEPATDSTSLLRSFRDSRAPMQRDVAGHVEVRVLVDAPPGTRVDTKHGGDVDVFTNVRLGRQGLSRIPEQMEGRSI